ncbi:MAG: peptide deformylase [bacterium]
MIHEIVTYGQEVLRHKAQPVPAITKEIKTLARDLLDSMYAARGVGLAAEQIGREEAICVIDVPAESENPAFVKDNAAIPMPLILVNPVITATTGKQRNDEGCLSFPDISAPITRPMQVTVNYLDLNGMPQTATAQGLLARAILHETDHLSGVLLVDRMSAIQRLAVAGQLKRLQADARQCDR